jgi:hypothetical protein
MIRVLIVERACTAASGDATSVDALYRVLGEISTEDFRNDAYLNLMHLRETAMGVEKRTGKELDSYE